jgi:hypothetical protein
MATVLRLSLPALGLLALLSACDPRSEEETNLPPAAELTAAEIVQQVVDAEKTITNIREDRTDISTQLAAPMGEVDSRPDETRSVRIQAGDDLYTKLDYGGAEDFCEGDPECEEPSFPFDETLYYRGTAYVRDRSGAWVLEPESGCPENDPSVFCTEVARVPVEHWEGTDGSGGMIGTGGFIETAEECPALASYAPPERVPVYSFEFSWLTNPEVIEAGAEDGLIHVRGTISESFSSFGLPPELEAIYAECGIELPDPFEGSDIPDMFRDFIPERYEGVADIWVAPDTFFVHRVDWTLDMINKERTIQSDQTSSRYSLFNEAELPGPLPE